MLIASAQNMRKGGKEGDRTQLVNLRLQILPAGLPIGYAPP